MVNDMMTMMLVMVMVMVMVMTGIPLKYKENQQSIVHV